MDVTFSVPAVPVAQPRQRHRVVTANGRTFASNYTPATAPVNAYKAAVQAAYSRARSDPPTQQPVCLWLTFVMPRPKRLQWQTRPMPRAPHSSKPDGDNLEKATKDALSKLAWHDDSQVWWCNRQKVYAAGDEQPHVEIRITAEG